MGCEREGRFKGPILFLICGEFLELCFCCVAASGGCETNLRTAVIVGLRYLQGGRGGDKGGIGRKDGGEKLELNGSEACEKKKSYIERLDKIVFRLK